MKDVNHNTHVENTATVCARPHHDLNALPHDIAGWNVPAIGVPRQDCHAETPPAFQFNRRFHVPTKSAT